MRTGTASYPPKKRPTITGQMGVRRSKTYSVYSSLVAMRAKLARRDVQQAIARRAGVTTGNLYRYYESKDALFDDVVSEALHALAGEELLDFCIANRERVIMLLGRAEGTPLEGFGERTARELAELAIEHFRARDPALEIPRPLRFDLDLIYRSFVSSMVEILSAFADEKAIRAAADGYRRYPLSALEALFASARAR